MTASLVVSTSTSHTDGNKGATMGANRFSTSLKTMHPQYEFKVMMSLFLSLSIFCNIYVISQAKDLLLFCIFVSNTFISFANANLASTVVPLLFKSCKIRVSWRPSTPNELAIERLTLWDVEVVIISIETIPTWAWRICMPWLIKMVIIRLPCILTSLRKTGRRTLGLKTGTCAIIGSCRTWDSLKWFSPRITSNRLRKSPMISPPSWPGW